MTSNISICIDDIEDEADGSKCLCLSVQTAIRLRDTLAELLAAQVGDVV